MIERTTVRLPSTLLNRARKKAAAEGRTLTELIEEGLRRTLEVEKSESLKPSLPRSSTAKGWLLPGVNLKEVEELDDREYVERLYRGFED